MLLFDPDTWSEFISTVQLSSWAAAGNIGSNVMNIISQYLFKLIF